jgi:hypothetical protein
MVIAMKPTHVTLAGERIIAPMLELAGCSKEQRIIVAGAKSLELMFELERRGYIHAAATVNCGRPARQYDVALIDWRGRPMNGLEATLDWLDGLLSARAVVVVWTNHRKPAEFDWVRFALDRCGFAAAGKTVNEDGCAVSGRRREAKPRPKAA